MSSTNAAETLYRAPLAWVNGTWQRNVLLGVSGEGCWTRVEPESSVAGVNVLDGAVLPGVVNAHSHAFQRAIAGLTERGTIIAGRSDDFWSWRDRMYSAANRVTPSQLEVIATHVYSELLNGGYTHVCEFHYLHNDVDGSAFSGSAEMSLAIVRAARRVGIGLTLLPTLYMRAGFLDEKLRNDQRRFASTPDSIVRVIEAVQQEVADDACINVGVALHSLRAVPPAALSEIASYAKRGGLPVHIHISEQTQEVEDCISATGLRPIDWLLENAQVDARWNLVHATHASPDELSGVAASGAAVVICPTTEANLGDGVFDFSGHVERGGIWSVGSDSHVTRRWTEELRLLEYSQRLTLRRRNVASQLHSRASGAAAMLAATIAGGRNATGLNVGAIAVGHRADFVQLDLASPALQGIPAEYLLDAAVFSSPDADFSAACVGGRQVSLTRESTFAEEMRRLWASDQQD